MLTYIKNNPKQICWSIVLFFFILLGLFLRLEVLDAVIVNEWVTRDFDRAFSLVDGDYIPLAGPEANNGGRLPGPFLYFLLAIPILLHYSYDSIFIFNLILNIASIGVLFFSLKKFFGHAFSCIASALVCVNTFHISGVFFPINPSFIFLFVSIFVWFYLEFALEGKVIFLPLQILTISLAVQLHYSMALLYLIPIISIVVFKNKISFKHIFLLVGVCLACFMPYLIYKKLYYYPHIAGAAGSGLEKFSLLGVLKLFTIPHTITNIVSNGSAQYWHSPIEIISLINKSAIYISVLIAIAFFVSKYKKGGWISCKKQLAVFFIFYIPAFVYEIIKPQFGHFWYAFIFVIPTAIFITQAGFIFFDFITVEIFKNILLISIFLLMIFMGYSSINHVNRDIQMVSEKVFRGAFEGSFRNYQNTLGKLMVALNMTPRQFYEKTYFLEARPSSIKRLEFAYSKLDQDQKNKIRENNEDLCYFLFDPHSNKGQVKLNLMAIFFLDKSIERYKQIQFASDDLEIKKKLKAITYKPKENQSCYNNLFNSFVVDKEVRSMLAEVRTINEKEDFVIGFKPFLKGESYDENNRLSRFEGSYVFINRMSELPFKLNLLIKKGVDGYHIRTEIVSVYFWRSKNFHFSSLRLNFLPKTTESSWRIVGKKELIKPLTILPEKTLASSVNNMSNVSDWSYNQFWYKEQIIPDSRIKLEKGQFVIGLSMLFQFDESSYCCVSDLRHKTFIPLNS